MDMLALFISIFLFSFAAAAVKVVIINDTEGYYWRVYKGEIPRDAVPGGSDKYGKATYIGQALHIFPPNGKLIPGTIDAAKGKMYYAWQDNAYEVTTNIKILCSEHPEQFQWIDTDIPTAQSMSQKDLVEGGYDTSYPLFIGKIYADGEELIGKVTLTNLYEAIGYAANGKPHFVKTMFKILSFNPEKVNTEDSCLVANTVNVTVY